MRDHDGALSFAPRLPEALTRLAFRLCFDGRRLHVEVHPDRAAYSLLDGPPLEISHHGEPAELARTRPLTRAIPDNPILDAPLQPRGRTPVR